jgi:hypothetical protein
LRLPVCDSPTIPCRQTAAVAKKNSRAATGNSELWEKEKKEKKKGREGPAVCVLILKIFEVEVFPVRLN